ncbi:unnamed protein product [Schistosoma turkestanicum]|nr:unnamed protein product [Schistosoma turkestanicum]
MESQTLTSATLSHSESVGSLNERSSDAVAQSPSTLRLTISPKLESDLQNNSDNQLDKIQIDTDKSEKIFLLPGTERVVKVIKKFNISDNNDNEFTKHDNEIFFDNNILNADNELDLNAYRKNQYTSKTEHKYYKTNVVHKRHHTEHHTSRRHRERHHQHRRRQQYHQHDEYVSGTRSSEQSLSPKAGEFLEKAKNDRHRKPMTSVQSSIICDPNNNSNEKRVISRLHVIAPGPAQSSDLDKNVVISTDEFLDKNQNAQSYLSSPNTNVSLSELKQNRLFLPSSIARTHNRYKTRSRQSERKSQYEKAHSSLNRLCSHISHDSGVCQKCHNATCSKCNENIYHSNHYNSDSRSLHRADMYCSRRLRGVSCSSSLDHICQLDSSRKYKSLSGSKLFLHSGHHNHNHHHHYHQQPHRHLGYAKSIPSLSTLDLHDTNSLYTYSLGSNRHINFMEIEYMQIDNNGNDNDNKNLPMGLSNEKLNWITNLARESLTKTTDRDLLAKLMKEALDQHFGKLWHSIVGTESYGSHLATLPGSLVSFRVDKWAFLLWQT